MYEFHPYFTNDGSVGLYSPEFNDIYHSATGALTEAYEKFIYPSNIEFLLNNYDEIKILDICYGIGYNTKSFLNYLHKIKSKNINYTKYYSPIYTNKIPRGNIDTIYSNNIIQNKAKDIDKIYSNNNSLKIHIDAVDMNEILTLISPFIKTGERHIDNFKPRFNYKNLEKYLAKESRQILETDEFIDYFIFSKIFENKSNKYLEKDIYTLITNDDYKPFFNQNIRAIYKNYYLSRRHNIPLRLLNLFLHNIYYSHVTRRYKKQANDSILNDITFNQYNIDARDFIKCTNNQYHIIFLDAFTPSKCPCLWTVDFFKAIYQHLDSNGMLLTYSSSPSIRSALREAGYNIGNNYNKVTHKQMGTIATKNSQFIKYPLTEYELGMLNTKSGIYYRDKNLESDNNTIIENRNNEINNSNKISLSEYKAKYSK